MLKLVFWLIVIALVYFYYKGRRATAVRRERELNEREENLRHREQIIDIEAEEIKLDR